MEEYRYECASIEGLVQRVVVLAQRGYRFFVQGEVPEHKDPEAIDGKFLGKYELRKTRRQRAYRKQCGLPNGHYFRHGRSWVSMATAREFFLEVDRRENVIDLRETPIRVGGYSISLRRDGSARRRGEHRYRASVRLDVETYSELRAHFEEASLHRSKEWLTREFWRESSRWQAYAPVHRQFRAMVKRVNARRDAAGYDRISSGAVRVVRSYPRHFEAPEGEEETGERISARYCIS